MRLDDVDRPHADSLGGAGRLDPHRTPAWRRREPGARAGPSPTLRSTRATTSAVTPAPRGRRRPRGRSHHPVGIVASISGRRDRERAAHAPASSPPSTELGAPDCDQLLWCSRTRRLGERRRAGRSELRSHSSRTAPNAVPVSWWGEGDVPATPPTGPPGTAQDGAADGLTQLPEAPSGVGTATGATSPASVSVDRDLHHRRRQKSTIGRAAAPCVDLELLAYRDVELVRHQPTGRCPAPGRRNQQWRERAPTKASSAIRYTRPRRRRVLGYAVAEERVHVSRCRSRPDGQPDRRQPSGAPPSKNHDSGAHSSLSALGAGV